MGIWGSCRVDHTNVCWKQEHHYRLSVVMFECVNERSSKSSSYRDQQNIVIKHYNLSELLSIMFTWICKDGKKKVKKRKRIPSVEITNNMSFMSWLVLLNLFVYERCGKTGKKSVVWYTWHRRFQSICVVFCFCDFFFFKHCFRAAPDSTRLKDLPRT